ncbi:MAG: FAD-binding and (Fe-S)-binding domain-containing protein [Acidiferrobacterales bacterium]
MSPESFGALANELQTFIPQPRLIRDPLRRLAFGTDASFYRLVPQLVVKVESEGEVSRIIQAARKHQTPITFRAAGTSVCGQAITDSVLVVLGEGWQDYEISADGSRIRLQPGVTGGRANQYLAPFNRKIGPDPASINAAKIGGIAANNSSGMCCLTTHNSYHTLVSTRLILADGTLLDTSNLENRAAFANSHAALLERLGALARETRANAVLATRIQHKFRMRNTTGYALNALLDFEDPIDILQHLMIGSEGTLGFIAEITFRTIEDPPNKASTLILFPDINAACQAATQLQGEPVTAVELMDRASLCSVEDKPGMPIELKQLSGAAAALLVDTRALDRTSLKDRVHQIERAIGGIETLTPVQFTDDIGEYTRLWNVRKGLYPSVGAIRDAGTTVVVEDVVFPLARLAQATADLQELLNKHAYDEAIILGHAIEGNLHFIFTQDFGKREEIDRYAHLMREFVELAVEKYDGSLKGEHGTGRNVAPYVEREWGHDAYRLMRDIKSILDPDNVLNPGVILNNDKDVHLKNLKPLVPVDLTIDKCIECGFCEITCPSNELTLTPRQRIVGLRELARLEAINKRDEYAQTLRTLYQYQGVDTCAGDGLCGVVCPVGIDTGKMMKILRGRSASNTSKRAAHWIANHFAATSRATRVVLGATNLMRTILGRSLTQRLTNGMRKLSGNRLPAWNPYLPTAARMPSVTPNNEQARVVYLPSCASRTMGPARGDPEYDALPAKMEALLRKAGYQVVIPDNCDELCCGLPFESKGFNVQADAKAAQAEGALRQASYDGRDLIVSDTSPCTLRLRQAMQAKLPLLDITEFVHDELMTRLRFDKLPENVALHATCSTRRMGLEPKLRAIAEACVETVIVPDDIYCCGWAGDKGFEQPELNASALRHLRDSLPHACVSGYSTSRTCEIGLSLHSDRHYRSIAYLVDRCTRSGS